MQDKIIGLTLIAMMFVLASILSSSNASTITQTFYVGDGGYETKTMQLQAEQTVTGSFSITGEGYDTSIDFEVIDPMDVILLELKSVYNGTNFTFKVFSDGEHKLVFDNWHGGSKYVELAYDVSSPSILDVKTQQILGVDIIVFSGIVIAIIAVLAILAFALYRNRARHGASQSAMRAFNLIDYR